MRFPLRLGWVTVLAGILTLSLGTAAPADPPPPRHTVDVVAEFDGVGELPEGVDVDSSGNLYVTLGPPFFAVGAGLFDSYGAVVKIRPDGTRQKLLESPTGPAPAGIVVDGAGRVVFARPDPGGPDGGLYALLDGQEHRIPGTGGMVVPNGLALARDASIFATDSILGHIVRVPADARTTSPSAQAEVWLAHELLRGCDAGDNAVGANGIAFHRRDVYVANTSRGALLRVPVARDGSPGRPRLVAGDPSCDPAGLSGLDGVAVDARGRVYAAVVLQDKLVRIDPRTGSWTELLTGEDGLWNPASIAFGTAGPTRDKLFISNYAVLGPDRGFGPAVLAYDTGVPGWPLG